jgi:hypothetical protein
MACLLVWFGSVMDMEGGREWVGRVECENNYLVVVVRLPCC